MQLINNVLTKTDLGLSATRTNSSNQDLSTSENNAVIEGQGQIVSTKVSISEEGYSKLAREQALADKDAVVRSAGKQVAEGMAGQSSETEEAKSTDPIDQLIEKIQEQIEEVKKQLARLEADDSEAAQLQKEVLSKQLLELNNQLVSLIEQKVQSLKSSGS